MVHWRDLLKETVPLKQHKKPSFQINTLDDLAAFLRKIRDNFVIKHDQDFVCVVGGYEGSGKSIDSIYLGLKVDESCFDIRNVAMDAEQFVDFELLRSNNEIPPGSCVVFDEGGTQMFSRDAGNALNKELVKQYVCNRYLNAIHFICVPKPGYLDKYIREDRVRMMMWAWYETNEDFEIVSRHLGVWFKDSVNHILSQRNWWVAFRDTTTLRRWFPPDIVINVPKLKLSHPVFAEYKEKKSTWNKDEFVRAKEKIKEIKEGKQEKRPWLEEGEVNITAYCKVTGRSRSQAKQDCADGKLVAEKRDQGWAIYDPRVAAAAAARL